VREEVLSGFIRLVAHTPELQAYTASRLFTSLQADVSQESLTLAAVWIIGEFSEILLETGLIEEEESKMIRDSDIVDLFENVLHSPYVNSLIRQFVITSLTKLSSRPRVAQGQRDRISNIINGFSTSPELEIQQRSVEFASLFNQGEQIFVGVLERMPVPEIKATVIGVVSEKKPVGSLRTDADMIDLDDSAPPTTANGQNGAHNDIASLLGFGGGGTSAGPAAAPGKTQRSAIDDILGLFDSSPNTGTATPPPASVTPQPVASLFDMTPTPAAPSPQPVAPAAPKLPGYTAYDKNNLKITLTPQVSATKPGLVNILARFQVTGMTPAIGLNFQAAVPKTQQLQMMPMSSPTVNPGATETQQMRVMAPVGAQVRLRLRISFTIGGQAVQDQVDFSGFPPNLTSGQ